MLIRDIPFSAVLNLPVTATAAEIRAQYRALSVLFHPDRHHDTPQERTAHGRFLELQRAYQVLSDPFSRVVYDTLGEKGLSFQWPEFLASQSQDEIRRFLLQGELSVWQRERERAARPQGQLTCGIDASTLVNEWDYPEHFTWVDRVKDRLHGIGQSHFKLEHGIQASINEKTNLIVHSQLLRGHPRSISRAALSGTVRHQFSPRLSFQTEVNVLFPQSLKVSSTYRTPDHSISVESFLAPSLIQRMLPPPVTVSLSRRLSRKSLTEGRLTYHTGQRGYFAFNVSTAEPLRGFLRDGPGSTSGLSHRALQSSYGFTLSGRQSGVKAEWVWSFVELALRAKTAFTLGFSGIGWEFGGAWTGETGQVEASVELNIEGVTLQLDLAYLEQRICLPLTLSHEYDVDLALWTTVIPLAAFAAGYCLIFKPRHLRRRARYIHNARAALNEDMSVIRREIEETRELLKHIARRHMDAEKESNGLIIVDASYGSEENDLLVDVTVALQALVHRSQLHIPGQRSKVGIPGFHDPAPRIPKKLRVNYTFRQMPHFAEFPDFAPVVLPLEAHAI